MQSFNIGELIVVNALFHFVAEVDIAIRMHTVKVDVPHAAHVLQEHGNAFQPVGDLDRYGIEYKPAGLLEIRELRDLQPVKPHFPTQSPRAQRGRFPVVFHEANIVLVALDAQCIQRIEINLLWISRIRLENNLKLHELLHAIGILAIAAIVGADRGFDVGDVPRFRAEHAQGGGRVHRARANLMVVRLPQRAASAGPEFLEIKNDLLKREWFGHDSPESKA